MRIILAARTHRGIGGSQTWNATVAKELRKHGHEVELWGSIDNTIQGLGPTIDLVILSQAQAWIGDAWACPTLNVSHGIIDLEKPRPGFDAYAFVSEECRDHWGKSFASEMGIKKPEDDTGGYAELWGSPAPIIRQPIDLDFWRPVRGDDHCPEEAHHGRQLIYRHSYYEGMDWLPSLAKEMGFEFVHGRNRSPLDARAMIQLASVVISSGRGALEAMACGVPTIIADDRPYAGGPLVATDKWHSANFSGRGGIEANHDSVSNAISETMSALPPGAKGWRGYVRGMCDVSMIVDQLLEAGGVGG